MFIGLLSACTVGSFGETLFPNLKRLLKSLPVNNRPWKFRPTIVNINSDKTPFYPFTVSFNKCGGCCTTIDYPYARVSGPKR